MTASDRPPPRADEAGDAEQHPRRQRKLRIERGEEGPELGQDEGRQHDDRDDGHDRHDRRIDQRGGDGDRASISRLEVLGQLEQHGVEVPVSSADSRTAT